uniref:BPTI/Kunitz inhibitor domain-containing protein n=1 Tax=Pseudonaja textilis TaxID=8673 RepID=A0A670ZP40_PSETE
MQSGFLEGRGCISEKKKQHSAACLQVCPGLLCPPVSFPLCPPEPLSQRPSELPLSPSLPVRSDQCQLPRNQGSCSKELQHFYYDPEEKKCISFVYHGCEGNSNNFPTRELCEKACGKISKGTEEACCIEVPAVCKLPADPGRCLAYSEQYYYNWNTKKCETFVYGMCNGNGNRFATKLECQMVCGEFGKEQPGGKAQPGEEEEEEEAGGGTLGGRGSRLSLGGSL